MTPAALIACIQISLLRRPLLHVQTVQDCLDKSRDEVNAMIESGELPFAFDLAPQRVSRREPRIFALCVAEKAGCKLPCGATKNFSLPEVVSMILPKRDVRSTELTRLFSCSHQQVRELTRNFIVVTKAAATSGPNSYQVFNRACVEAFLSSRRML